ncbi:DUF4240 domain-containing protein [Streptomyces sp. NPDC055254]
MSAGDFALWLVAQGRGTYESVIADPDVLADASEVRALAGRHVGEWHDDEWPEWEELDYVAQDIFDELNGQKDDCEDAFYDALEAVRAAWAESEERDETERAMTQSGARRLSAGTGTPRLDALFLAETRD